MSSQKITKKEKDRSIKSEFSNDDEWAEVDLYRKYSSIKKSLRNRRYLRRQFWMSKSERRTKEGRKLGKRK
jgi:hypothetical protein